MLPPLPLCTKTRSPGCGWETGVATVACPAAEWGSEMPTWPKTYCVKPEQSKASGPAAP
jgi:hypothetical protein